MIFEVSRVRIMIFLLMILREASRLSIDLPSRDNFSVPFKFDVLVTLSYERLFCLSSDNLYRWVVDPSIETITSETLRFPIESGITPVVS